MLIVKFETPEYLGFQQEQINAQLITLATQVNSRGLPYAEDMSQFVCAIIQDPSVIFSSIESNLRNINNTIRSVAGSTQEEKKTHP